MPSAMRRSKYLNQELPSAPYKLLSIYVRVVSLLLHRSLMNCCIFLHRSDYLFISFEIPCASNHLIVLTFVIVVTLPRRFSTVLSVLEIHRFHKVFIILLLIYAPNLSDFSCHLHIVQTGYFLSMTGR